MALRHFLPESSCQPCLHRNIRVQRGFEAIRQQSLKAPKALPIGKNRGMPEELNKVFFVIAFQKDRSDRALASNKKIEHLARIGSAVDVVAQKDLQWLGYWTCGEICLDAAKK